MAGWLASRGGERQATVSHSLRGLMVGESTRWYVTLDSFCNSNMVSMAGPFSVVYPHNLNILAKSILGFWFIYIRKPD